MVKTIMVVDDESDVRDSLRMVFENAPPRYNVICANSGKECLRLLRNNKIPDLIILDIMMPMMSGWETQQRLKDHQVWKNIPIIFLTAVPERGIKNIENFEGDDYIEKPVDIIELKRRIRNILRRRKKAVHF